jgi:hypothetical protein
MGTYLPINSKWGTLSFSHLFIPALPLGLLLQINLLLSYRGYEFNSTVVSKTQVVVSLSYKFTAVR